MTSYFVIEFKQFLYGNECQYDHLTLSRPFTLSPISILAWLSLYTHVFLTASHSRVHKISGGYLASRDSNFTCWVVFSANFCTDKRMPISFKQTSAVYSPQSTVRSPQSTVHSPQSGVRSPQSAVHSSQSAVRSPQSAAKIWLSDRSVPMNQGWFVSHRSWIIMIEWLAGWVCEPLRVSV